METYRQQLMFGIPHDYQKKLKNRGKNLTELLNNRLHPKILEYYTKNGVVPDFDDLMNVTDAESPRPSFSWIRENLECSNWLDLADQDLIEKVVKITDLFPLDNNEDEQDESKESGESGESGESEEFDKESKSEEKRPRKRAKKKTDGEKLYEERVYDKLDFLDSKIAAYERKLAVLQKERNDISTWWENRPTI
jgi:hypothetical protein